MKKNRGKPPILIGDVIISSEVTEELFTCDVSRCKGACCVEGELGAPLEKSERRVLEEVYDAVEPYLPEAGRQAVQKQGQWVLDSSGDFSTPLVDRRECAYTVFDEHGVAQCGIELAYNDGKIDFRKPISCHLYPIRVLKSRNMEALNYDRWDICKAACALGGKTGLRVYEFTKDALIRAYGEAFYEELDGVVKSMKEE